MRQLVTLGLEELSASTMHILRSIQPRGPHRTTGVGFWGVVIELSGYGIAHEAGHQATACCEPTGVGGLELRSQSQWLQHHPVRMSNAVPITR